MSACLLTLTGFPDTVEPYTWPEMAEFFLVPLDRRLCSGHDVSDGGLVTCLLEMAFAGNCGIEVDVPAPEIHGELLGSSLRSGLPLLLVDLLV